MNPSLAAFAAELSQLVQTQTESYWLEGVCRLLGSFMSAEVQIADENDMVVMHISHLEENALEDKPIEGQDQIELSLPVISQSARLGTLNLYRMGLPFGDVEVQMADMALTVYAILLGHAKENAAEEKRRRAEAVRAVVNTLSFSELEAASHIIQSLNGREGILIAGHTADKLGFTRSVVVNALRKLEGAGTIETRSLGMKGTYISVKDPLLALELRKL